MSSLMTPVKNAISCIRQLPRQDILKFSSQEKTHDCQVMGIN